MRILFHLKFLRTCTERTLVPDGFLFIFTIGDSICFLPTSVALTSQNSIAVQCPYYVDNGYMGAMAVNYYNGAVYLVANFPRPLLPLPTITRIYLHEQVATPSVVNGVGSVQGVIKGSYMANISLNSKKCILSYVMSYCVALTLFTCKVRMELCCTFRSVCQLDSAQPVLDRCQYWCYYGLAHRWQLSKDTNCWSLTAV